MRRTDELIRELHHRACERDVVALVVGFDDHHAEVCSTDRDPLEKLNALLRVDGARVLGFVAISSTDAGELSMTIHAPWSYAPEERAYCQRYLEGVADQFRETLATHTSWRE